MDLKPIRNSGKGSGRVTTYIDESTGEVMTAEDFAEMLEVQGSTCAICGNTSEKRLHVDHDHETGRVRGLLCFTCNTLLGNAKDDPRIILAAAEYLMRHKDAQSG